MRRRVGFVVPWPESGRWIWDGIDDPGFDLSIVPAIDTKSHLATKPVTPYVAEFRHLLPRRRELLAHDILFAWELRSALAVGCLLPRKRGPRFIAVGPILKGGILKALPLLRFALSRAEKIVCFSSAECDENACLLELPRDRFIFVPTPWRADEAVSADDGGFALALGQSNRDYATLIRAARDTDVPLLIVAGDESALGGEALSENISVRYNTGHHETLALIGDASFHVVPLHDAGYSSGQTVLLRAMARGKAVIVSDIAGVRDYVRPGETALSVPPGDVDALRRALLQLWNDPVLRKTIGERAAQAVRAEFGFPTFARKMLDLVR